MSAKTTKAKILANAKLQSAPKCLQAFQDHLQQEGEDTVLLCDWNWHKAILKDKTLRRFYGWMMDVGIIPEMRLEFKDLSGMDLSHADLRRVRGFGANFKGANLQKASFEGSDIEKANLEGANCIGACFDYCRMSYTNLINADLEGASMKQTLAFFVQR